MTERQIEVRLGQLARRIERSRSTLAADLRERDELYELGVEQGILQRVLADWSGSTAPAVAKTLEKRRNGVTA